MNTFPALPATHVRVLSIRSEQGVHWFADASKPLAEQDPFHTPDAHRHTFTVHVLPGQRHRDDFAVLLQTNGTMRATP